MIGRLSVHKKGPFLAAIQSFPGHKNQNSRLRKGLPLFGHDKMRTLTRNDKESVEYFLDTAGYAYGTPVKTICEKLIEAFGPTVEFSPDEILSQACAEYESQITPKLVKASRANFCSKLNFQ